MKISTRTQAILAATVFFFVITLFIVANGLIHSTYSQIELQQCDAATQLVSEYIRYEFEDLGTKARDWAVWDDTYQFVEDKNDHYRAMVIDTPTTYESLQISGLVFYDAKGEVIAAQGYDLQNKTLIPISGTTLDTLKKSLSTISNIRGGKKKQGLVMLPSGPTIVGMHAILQTNGMGYGHGTIVMIQPFDEGRINTIRSHTHLPVRIYPLDAPAPETTPDPAILTAPDAPPRYNQIHDESTMTGYFLLSDFENRPAIMVAVDSPRTASQQMYGNVVILIAAFACLGVISILITGYLLKRTIIAPLTDLDLEMKQIGHRGDLTHRLPVSGDDEIASLKVSFNVMLQELQDKEAELKRRGDLLAEANRKANLYLDIYLDVLTYEILNVTISLQAYAELIRESGDVTNQEYADRITTALNRNLTVIRNIETISRIYKHPPGPGPVSLRTIIGNEMKKFPGIPINSLQEDVMVVADDMLGIVFHNILLNCIKFGREEIEIWITTRDLPGGIIEISVTDNGTGIADDMKSLIFDRFMKGTDKRSSYGLGLHIVKMLIEAYGGKVWADDRVPGRFEQGAAIRFTLRRA